MELTESHFERTTEISIDWSYAQPKIQMKDKKSLVHEFVCPNKEAANELFDQLLGVWNEIKIKKHG